MSAIDPITLEVVQGAFVHTVMQMRATLIRTAYASYPVRIPRLLLWSFDRQG